MPVNDPKRQNTLRMLEYYRSRPGQIIYYGDAADDLSISRPRANAAIGRVATKYPEMGFKRSGMSGFYVYLSNAPGPENAHGVIIPETYPAEMVLDNLDPVPAEDYYKDEPTKDTPKIPARSSLNDVGEVYEAIYRQKSNGRMIVRDSHGDLYYLTEM
jgi:hypothetical protein